jgi:two-component system, cell cycle sensor histidine kinase and response regulator CckA
MTASQAAPLVAEPLRRVSRVCAAAAIAIGVFVLAGWLFGVRALMQVRPGQVAMVPNTAVAFLLAGLALWMRASRDGRSGVAVSRVAAALAGVLGLLNLAEYAWGTSLGIDEFLFRDPTGLTSAFPGRMAVLTAVGFVALAAALLTLNSRRAPWTTDGLALLPGFLAMVSLTGYIYGVPSLSWVGIYKGMAIHTALAFLVLSVGVLLVNARGLSRLLVSDTAGGVVARRVLPVALLAPFVLGWLRIAGQERGLYGLELGRALYAVSDALLLTVILLGTAAALMRADEKRRRTEEALRAAEEQYRLLFENSPHPMWVADRETLRFLAVNDAAVEHYGFPRDEFLSMNIGQIRPPEDVTEVRRAIQEKEGLERWGVWRHLKKDGTVIHVDIATHTLKFAGRSAWLVLAYDVTDRLRAEESLRASERRFRSYFDLGLVGMAITSPAKGVIEVNDEICRILGYERHELLNKTWAEMTHPQDLAADVTNFNRVLAGETDGYAMEKRWIRKDGQIVDSVISVRCVRHDDGSVDHFVALLHDITERKRAGEELAKRELYFRSLIEHALDIVAVIAPDGEVRYASPSGERILGYPLAHLAGRSAFDLIHPDDRSLAEGTFRRSLETGTKFEQLEARVRHRDGSWRTLSFIGRPLPPETGMKGLIINARDLTDHQRLEAQLRVSQKMEGIGRLAGGIAHDFNNLLTAILGYSELMEAQLPDDENLRSSLREIQHAGERAAALTRQLLAFSRRQVLQPKLLDLNEVVSEVEKLLRRLIGEDVKLVTRLHPGLEHIKADPGQLEQVLMNLAVNARDAMPEGGTLTIETANAQLDARFAAGHPGARSGEYTALKVADTGIGMSEDVRSHAFEPFFTTKEQGKGTGLGLATAYGIVKQSDGYITVESEPGRGTTFRIYFPRAAGAATPSGLGERPPLSPRGAETILLVEDEPGVRRLSRSILEAQGYTVLEAASGDEALGVARSYAGEIHMVTTDVVMPGMSGRVLWDQLRLLRPAARVLFMSGYTDDAIAKHGVLEPGIAFLQKPFTPFSLAQKVREVLDR